MTARMRWTGTLLAWVVLVTIFTTQDFLASRWFGPGRRWEPMLVRQIVVWTAWALLTPAIIAFTRRVRSGMRALGAHVAFGVVTALAHTLMVAAVYPLFYYAPSFDASRDVFRARFTSFFGVDLLVYAALAAGARAIMSAREAQEREIARVETSERAAKAELALLYGQLQPHFLFNTLNSIVELVDSDPPRATSMLRSLSVLLRRALASVHAPQTTVSEEMEFVQRYVEIQQVRFPELVSTVHCDPLVSSQRIPSMLLQPLVENAIRYASSVRGAGSISVSAGRVDHLLRFRVTDDGVGLQAGTGLAGAGTGLANVRARLQHMFGSEFALTLSPASPRGTVVTLDLPLGEGSPRA